MFTRLWRLHALRQALALALVAGFLATPVAISHAGLLAHDPCDAPGAAPDPAAPRMGAPDGAHADGHCFTCHWFRNLRTSLVSAGVDVSETGPAVLLRAETVLFAVNAAGPAAGARAPPA